MVGAVSGVRGALSDPSGMVLGLPLYWGLACVPVLNCEVLYLHARHQLR